MSDPLRDVLELASRDGALQGEGLEAFVEALRERARLVLAERVSALEERVRALEAETAWRRESMASLEAEVSWRRESMEALEKSVRGLGEELRRAQDAHAALLVHQRELVERVAAELLSVAALSPLRIREARRRLRDLAGLLRVDSR
jgi:uncharacterized coiled-coil protein SlyX